MFTLITGWVTERIVTFLAVILVSFSTIPTTLILVSNHESDEAIHVQLIQQVRAEGDAVLVQLNSAGQNCDAQIAQLLTVKATQLPAVVLRLIADGKEREHATVLTFVEQVRAEESRVAAIRDLDDDDVQFAVERIHFIGATALGPNGVVLVTCQTIIIEIRTVIEIVVRVERHHEDNDD